MNNGQLDFLDILNIMSFIIGLMNYDENLTQNDKQDLMQELNAKSDKLLEEIHKHLTEQDKKIDTILKEVRKNEDNQKAL
jgi:hypothetical protein